MLHHHEPCRTKQRLINHDRSVDRTMSRSAILYGVFTGVSIACSAQSYLNYAIEKTAVLQTHLLKAPELTDKVIDAANKAA